MSARKQISIEITGPSRVGNCAVIALLAVLVLVSRVSRADTIVSSLSNNLQSVSFQPGLWAASSFTMGPQSFTLTNVMLSLLQGGANSSLAGVQGFSDNAGHPGAPLLDLGSQTITGFQPQLWSFSSSSGLTLNAFTTYWVAVGNISPNQGLNVSVALDMPFNFSGQPGTMMAFSGASGMGSGANPPAAFDAPGGGSAIPFQADGIPGGVPEPGSFACLMMGAVSLLVWKRRHRQARD